AAGTKPGAGTSVVGFTGHVQDAETDLVYMQQRYYDPIAGRFLSVDPIVTDANTGKGFGLYSYADNNPYVKVDPDGRDPKQSDPDKCWWTAGCGILVDSGRSQNSEALSRNSATVPAPSAAPGSPSGDGSGGSTNILVEVWVFLSKPRGSCAQPAGCYGGAAPLPLAVGGVSGTLKTGELFERTFHTSKGVVDFVAEVQIVGDKLILNSAILYGRSEVALTGLTREIYRGIQELRYYASTQGFAKLQINGVRAVNSSSATPGATWSGEWSVLLSPP
ncbi:RHS repeat-associated core domain-containing protein, partial [Pelomonas sp. P7]